ncbi:MAG TPA: hypothetical protein VF024_12125 [Solirubrobacteraceae bacterium]
MATTAYRCKCDPDDMPWTGGGTLTVCPRCGGRSPAPLARIGACSALRADGLGPFGVVAASGLGFLVPAPVLQAAIAADQAATCEKFLRAAA